MHPDLHASFMSELRKEGAFLPPELFDPEAWRYAAEGIKHFDHHDALRMLQHAGGVAVSKGAASAAYRALAQKGPLSFISKRMSAGVGTNALHEMAEGKAPIREVTQASMHSTAPREVDTYRKVRAGGEGLISAGAPALVAAGVEPAVAEHMAHPDGIQHPWNEILRGFTGPIHEAPGRLTSGVGQAITALPLLARKAPGTAAHVGKETAHEARQLSTRARELPGKLRPLFRKEGMAFVVPTQTKNPVGMIQGKYENLEGRGHLRPLVEGAVYDVRHDVARLHERLRDQGLGLSHRNAQDYLNMEHRAVAEPGGNRIKLPQAMHMPVEMHDQGRQRLLGNLTFSPSKQPGGPYQMDTFLSPNMALKEMQGGLPSKPIGSLFLHDPKLLAHHQELRKAARNFLERTVKRL